MEKKQYITIGIVAIIAIAGVSGVVVYMNMPKGGKFVFGVMYGPVDLDPHQAWDSASIDVIHAVVEGLLDVDVADPDLAIIPNLATSYSWSTDSKEITFVLRQGVKFHDGTDFDATVVKWNFDRLYGLIDEVQLAELWLLPTAEWIIKETVVVDTYTVKIVLNEPYAPLLGLLASWSAYFMSPAATNKTALIDTATGDLVGTGPYIYDGTEAEVEVSFTPNPNYWDGKPAVDDMIFAIITDADAKNAALLTGEISLIDSAMLSMIPTFEADPNIQVVDAAPSLSIQYLGINNELIPVEMRKAICYALDYDYIIDELMQGYAMRMTSPIPKGILYHNDAFDYPVLDLTIARQALLDANWPGTEGLTVTDDAAWVAKAASSTPLATYNYTYNIGNEMREDMLIVCQDNFGKIGVAITDSGMTWGEYIKRGYEVGDLHRNMLELWWLGWIPDYNDPSNFINMLMTNTAIASNMAKINDAQLQSWMEAAVTEIDPAARKVLYDNIQQRCAEVIYPWCYGYVSDAPWCGVANLRGYQQNAMKDVFDTIYFV